MLGSCVNFYIFFNVLAGTLPLSNVCNLCKKLVSANYFLATAQLGYLFNNIMTAFSTTSTPPGGVVYDLTTDNLSLVRFANPCSAATSAGSAFLRSS